MKTAGRNLLAWILHSTFEEQTVDKLEEYMDELAMVGIETSDDNTSKNYMEWELRGEKVAAQFDSLLKQGKILRSKSEASSSVNTLTLENFAKMMPLRVFDGGFTDNLGIGRAVMEHLEWNKKHDFNVATHLTSIAHSAEDFLGLFENNSINLHPDVTAFEKLSRGSLKLPECHINFEVFKCSQDEMSELVTMLDLTKPLKNVEEMQTYNFKLVERTVLKTK